MLPILLLIGILDWVSDVLAPSMNTIGTNIMQCLNEGPRIVQTPLDLELNTPKPGIVRIATEPPASIRTVTGNKHT